MGRRVAKAQHQSPPERVFGPTLEPPALGPVAAPVFNFGGSGFSVPTFSSSEAMNHAHPTVQEGARQHPLRAVNPSIAGPINGPFPTSVPDQPNSNPMPEGNNVSYPDDGFADAFNPPASSAMTAPHQERGSSFAGAADFFDTLSTTTDRLESANHVANDLGSYGSLSQAWTRRPSLTALSSPASDAGSKVGDYANTAKGLFETVGGVRAMFADGVNADNALDTGKGMLDTVAGAAGVLGNNRVKGAAGVVSGGIDVGRGLYTAIGSDDVSQATAGAQQAASGLGSVISSFGDATKNPLAMAAGRSFNLGLSIGRPLQSAADRIAEERGYFHNDIGSDQTASAEAADWGRSVDDFFGHSTWAQSKPRYLLDKAGGFAGGLVAAGAGIGNTAYTFARNEVETLTDGVSELLSADSGVDVQAWEQANQAFYAQESERTKQDEWARATRSGEYAPVTARDSVDPRVLKKRE